MDSDVLIKLTKASIKDFVASGFEVYIPTDVRRETVDEGKVRGYADAHIIEENIASGKLKLAGAKRDGPVEKLIGSLNLLGGEADSLRLFRQGNYGAIVSDDRRFVGLIEGLGITYMTPTALLLYLWRIGSASKAQTRMCVEKIKPYISAEEYLSSIEELGKEK